MRVRKTSDVIAESRVHERRVSGADSMNCTISSSFAYFRMAARGSF